MNTNIIAQPTQAVLPIYKGFTEVSDNNVSEITRRLAGLSKDELRAIQGAIAGWLGEPIAPTEAPVKAPDTGPSGWVECQYKPVKKKGVVVPDVWNGPYYSRCWWLPMENGRRKKGRIYIGKSLNGGAAS